MHLVLLLYEKCVYLFLIFDIEKESLQENMIASIDKSNEMDNIQYKIKVNEEIFLLLVS